MSGLCDWWLSAAGFKEKPAVIKTHLRDMLITPDLIGSIVAVYSGKVSKQEKSDVLE